MKFLLYAYKLCSYVRRYGQFLGLLDSSNHSTVLASLLKKVHEMWAGEQHAKRKTNIGMSHRIERYTIYSEGGNYIHHDSGGNYKVGFPQWRVMGCVFPEGVGGEAPVL